MAADQPPPDQAPPERRSDGRYVVKRPALLRRDGGDMEATCTSISSTGGFLATTALAKPGDRIVVSIQPRRASRADIELTGTVVYVVRPGSVQPQGLGVRWHPPKNSEPLEILLRWAANMTAQGLTDDAAARRDTLLDMDPAAATQAGDTVKPE